ncbi:MAG: LacI family transcriptional regulator [Oligosphaeraceae bacterium]|nr:LacI family transcriptional regulator [Oligosphaeraceae bacterium]
MSPTTVSFYLNGNAKKFNLSQATCEKIQHIINQYNYRPNFHARAINKCKTYLIGLVISRLEVSFFSQLVGGIERELARQGFYLVFSESDNDPATELKAIRYMNRIGVDGFILAPTFQPGESPIVYEDNILCGKPIQYVLYGTPSVPWLDTDHTIGTRLIFDELWRYGHRQMAYLGPELTGSIDNFLNERFRVFSQCFTEQGLEVKAFSDLNTLVAQIRDFTAVFCFCDEQAAELMLALQKRGVRIPEEISIVGYGNDSGVAKFVRPIIATVGEYKEELGTVAAKNLLRKIKEPSWEIPMRVRLAPKFIPGETIAQASLLM